MRIILTGGGSGGHVSPALAVAKHLQQNYPDCQLLYIGGTLTMEGSTGPSVEQSIVSQTDIPFVAIPVGKLKRDGLSLKTLTRLWGVVPGIWAAWRQIKKFKPTIVFSSGGYVAVPVVFAAWLQRVPVVIHEQTAAVGLANSLSAKLAAAIAITFPQSAAYFPADKVVVTGNPVSSIVTHPQPAVVNKTPAGQWLQQSNQSLPLLYITGGGQGSHTINQAIESLLPDLLQDWRVIHQTGSNQHFADYDRLAQQAASWSQSQRQNYYLAKHLNLEEIGGIYAQARLIIARAGANTVLEIAYWGIPAIFIPIPWVTHDEQTKNATALVEAGTATIIPEASLSPDSLLAEIHRQAESSTLTAQARQSARSLIQPQASAKIAELLLQHQSTSTPTAS